MKAWWSDHYSDENKAWLESLFGPPKWWIGGDIYFVAVPSEVDTIPDSCRLLVCPFTTPPQNVPNGIKVIHLQGHPLLNTITPTVELTWQLILRLVRPIDAALESVKAGQWDRFPFGADRMLSRMNLLVIGRGRIGSRVEVIGQAFGMKTKAISAFVYGSVLEEVDIVTLHTPPLDYSVLGGVEFGRMKKGVYIVNTAQGNAIDRKWLLDGLQQKNIAGAALDVVDTIEDFQYLKDYARTHDNLILTPHIGGSTKDAWHETQKMVIEKALEYLNTIGLIESIATPIG